jgi:hypothetical protein
VRLELAMYHVLHGFNDIVIPVTMLRASLSHEMEKRKKNT